MRKDIKRKKQHFVPKFYLRNFADKNNQTNILNIKAQKIVNSISYMDQCYENYYYGKDMKWEKKLSLLESEWATIFFKICNDKNYFPTKDEINKIKKFAIFQKNRTTIRETQIKEMGWKTVNVAIDMKSSNIFNRLDIDSKNKLKEKFLKDNMNNIPKMCLDIANNSQKYIDDLKMLIINYSCKTELIASDNPIIHYNNFCIYNVGLFSIGITIFFPISPSKLIVFYDAKVYSKDCAENILTLNNDTEVKWLNHFQMISANNLILFRNSNMSNYLLQLFFRAKKERAKFFAQFVPQTIGSQTNKIIFHHEANHPIKYSFSFTKLINRAVTISKYDRVKIDNFPRKGDKECLLKLNIRENILPQVHESFQGKDSQREVRNVNKFIRDYWNNKL